VLKNPQNDPCFGNFCIYIVDDLLDLNRITLMTIGKEKEWINWENGYVESFNGKLRDELINREVFTTLLEAKTLIGGWRREYNEVRPHSSLGYRPPAPETTQPVLMLSTLT
jgi:putative transposase